MDPSLNTSDAVKELAIQGKFAEIESRFGKKRSLKAENYVEVKLSSLKDKRTQGLPLDSVHYATAFMLYAVDRFETKVSPFQRVGRICIVHVHI